MRHTSQGRHKPTRYGVPDIANNTRVAWCIISLADHVTCVWKANLWPCGEGLLNWCLPYKWITKRTRLAAHSESIFWWFKHAWCMTSLQNREQSPWKQQKEWTDLSSFCHLGIYYKSVLIFWPLKFSIGRRIKSLIYRYSDSGVRDRMDHTVLLRHMLSRFVRQLP